MSYLPERETREIILAINRILGYPDNKNPKKFVFKLLVHLAVLSKKEDKQMKGLDWVLNRFLKFRKNWHK
ncbi:MAG: hypothetical protein WCF67_14350 [Chitinophagaceae bacterium]